MVLAVAYAEHTEPLVMSGVASVEARVHLAQRYLALDAAERRDRLVGAPPLPTPLYPDARPFARDARAALAVDPAAALTLAEAWVVAALRGPAARYEAALAAKPVVLRGEANPVPLRAVVAASMCERNGARREALMTAAEALFDETREPARAVVHAMRDALAALDPALRDATLPQVPDVDGVLAVTEDLWRELDLRVRRTMELDPARLHWSDRLHTLQGPSVAAQVPPATWSALAVRWWERVGLEPAARGVRDALGASSPRATGVHALITEPGARALLGGQPSPTAWDAAAVLGAGSVLAGSVIARGTWSAHRRGVDRASDGALHALGRRLLHDRTFLRRSAQVDAAPRERVTVEALHAEVARVRLDAVLGRFTRAAVERAPELNARFVAALNGAWGVAPALSWAVHLAADAFATGASLGTHWGRRALGSGIEVALREQLRARFDEDWHRNPRTGEWLRGELDAMRVLGAKSWLEGVGADVSPAALAKRLAEDFEDARRP